MKKSLLILLSTLTIAPLFGTGFCSFNNNCWCNDNTQLFLDFLYWRTHGPELNYLYTTREIDDPDHAGNRIATNKNYDFCPGWNPGVRLGMETGIGGCPDLNVFATWTWYEASDEHNVNLVKGSDGNETLAYQSDFFGVAGDGTARPFDEASISSDFYFMLNRVDLGASKLCCICSDLKIKPFAAFTYIHTDEKVTLTEVITPAADQNSYSNAIEYCGYGATIGQEYEWDLACNFSLFGMTSVTALWGEYSTKQENIFGQGDNDPRTTDHLNFSKWTGRTIGHMQIGLKACTQICNCYDVYGIVGWEYLQLWNQTDWRAKTSNDLSQGNKPVGDLALQGLFVRLAMTF